MLDPAARNAFLFKIRELHRQGMTILYVTHYMEEAVFADKIIILKDGKVFSQGKPVDILNRKEILYENGLELPEVVSIANHFRDLGWDFPLGILTPEDLLLQHFPSFEGLQTHTNHKIRTERDYQDTYRNS